MPEKNLSLKDVLAFIKVLTYPGIIDAGKNQLVSKVNGDYKLYVSFKLGTLLPQAAIKITDNPDLFTKTLLENITQLNSFLKEKEFNDEITKAIKLEISQKITSPFDQLKNEKEKLHFISSFERQNDEENFKVLVKEGEYRFAKKQWSKALPSLQKAISLQYKHDLNKTDKDLYKQLMLLKFMVAQSQLEIAKSKTDRIAALDEYNRAINYIEEFNTFEKSKSSTEIIKIFNEQFVKLVLDEQFQKLVYDKALMLFQRSNSLFKTGDYRKALTYAIYSIEAFLMLSPVNPPAEYKEKLNETISRTIEIFQKAFEAFKKNSNNDYPKYLSELQKLIQTKSETLNIIAMHETNHDVCEARSQLVAVSFKEIKKLVSEQRDILNKSGNEIAASRSIFSGTPKKNESSADTNLDRTDVPRKA